MKNLNEQYNLKNDQYPRDLKAMYEVLNGHTWDDQYWKLKKERRERNNEKNNE